MRLVALLCLLGFALTASAASVYKWTDEHGRVHYTQTPPPDFEGEVSERVVEAPKGEGLGEYCSAVRRFAYELAVAMARRVPLADAVSVARSVDSKLLQAGAEEAQLQEVAFFVYGKQAGYRSRQMSLQTIASLAETSCLSGNFAMVKGPRQAGAKPAGKRSGSGWFAERGLVVTSLHVVEGAAEITLHLSDGRSVAATLIEEDARNDLALLSTSERSVAGLPVRFDEVGIGTAVFTIGFPHAQTMGVRPKLSDGVVSSTAGLRDDPSQYQISVPVQAGNSGGPLVDMQGRVIGVVAAKLRANNMLRATGDLTENVNYAVKAGRLRTILGASEPPGAAGAGSRSLDVLAKEVEASVVRIVVQ